MMSALFDALGSDRRPLLDLCLAAIALVSWLLLDGFRVQVALSRGPLELAITELNWEPGWELPPWLAGAAILLFVWARLRVPRLAASGNGELAHRLRLAGAFTAALLVIRLAALWSPVTYLFPFLAILWAPHGTWGLLLFYLVYLHLPLSNRVSTRPFRLSDSQIAALLLVAGTIVYAGYALYFCQLTMLHGDEGQYLRVTQSLLHDGDMDLANNLSQEQTDEFHVVEFAVNPSPGSPPDKVHSQHPIGLSVGLLPAYWLGLELWQNPRLAAALFMTLLTAACLAVAFLWLRRLGVGRPLALAGITILGTTAPLFLYSNQLYPEIPALLIIFAALHATAHWQLPGGGYRSRGRLEPLLLGLLLLLLSCLPFLHPRYAPIALLGAVPILLQGWNSPRRRANLTGLALVATLAMAVQLAHNFALTDDWMGLFRPGNYRSAAALDIATWGVSLPGHWLHSGVGLLRSSPVFLLSLLGCAALVRTRDRRLLMIGGLYLATAATNGLHPLWDFGFCYPGRFMVTALPVLLYGLVLALPLVARSRLALLVASVTLAVSLETVATTILLPELGYEGHNLFARESSRFYPAHIHFFPNHESGLPLLDITFWSILLTALFILVVPHSHSRTQRIGITLAAALLPFIWGRSDRIASRVDDATSPYIDDVAAGKAAMFWQTVRPEHLATGTVGPGGGLLAKNPAHTAGFLGQLSLPPLLPGSFRARLVDLRVQAPGEIGGHFYVARRYTLPDVSQWEDRFSQPLSGETGNPDDLFFDVVDPRLGYGFVEFSGAGELAFSHAEVGFSPTHRQTVFEEVYRRDYPEEKVADGPILLGTRRAGLPPGNYRVRYCLEGSGFPAFFQRHPTPIAMAVYSAPADAGIARFQELAEFWLGRNRATPYTIGSPTFLRPQTESIHPPWWLSVPFTGDRFFEQRFRLEEDATAWILFSYDGPLDLRISAVILAREKLPL